MIPAQLTGILNEWFQNRGFKHVSLTEVTIAKSFRKSFTSSTGVLESREVSGFSIITLPLASTIGIITFLLGQIASKVVAMLGTKRHRTN